MAILSLYGSLQRSLVVNIGISFFVRALSAIALFLVSIFLGRLLGAFESGYYFLAFSVITFLAGMCRMGLDNSVLRFVSAASSDKDWSLAQSVMVKGLVLTGLSSIFVALTLYFGSDYFARVVFSKPQLGGVFSAMAPGIIGLAFFTLFAMGLQGLHKIVASIMTLNIFSNAFLICLLFGLGVSSAIDAANAYSIAAALAAVSGGYLWVVALRRRGFMPTENRDKNDTSRVSWTKLFHSCMPLWVVLMMGQLVQWSGQFVAGAYVDSGIVAQLAVAQRTAMLTSFVLMAVNLVVAPRFAAMYKQGQMKELHELAVTSVRLMVLSALPVVLFMVVFPEFLMSLFGEGFSKGAHLLQILVVGQFVNVATGSVGYLLSMSGHEKDLRNTVLISGPVAIGLALTLTPVWGATGSAVATALAVATQNLLAVWQVKRRLGINTLAVWRTR
ncbi:hypothetical protein AWR36_011520 [Microbulbifer flavimaris]|uniref:Membrane protein involved in the export of O-antigen and teichoic acid n=1 Tax=Microbulbifer flavimaris TaxID=1781068 RepID=A0ABX4HYJ2_9GAMM|nr:MULTISPECIES: oligosaccharide flippase family protein [Microbulbifer]PCO04638.1 hypothetical protein AWR36_011520 [Microbulbifer flavimaris]